MPRPNLSPKPSPSPTPTPRLPGCHVDIPFENLHSPIHPGAKRRSNGSGADFLHLIVGGETRALALPLPLPLTLTLAPPQALPLPLTLPTPDPTYPYP